MTAANKAKLEKLSAVFKDNTFTAKEAAEVLSVSVSYARRLLNKMYSDGIVERYEGDNKYLYKIPHIETSDNDEKEDFDSDENVSTTYEIYFNGRKVSSINSTLNEVIDTVKGIYPDSQIEIDDNKIYITKRLGTKG